MSIPDPAGSRQLGEKYFVSRLTASTRPAKRHAPQRNRRGAWRSMCLFDFAGVGHWEETVHEIVTRAIIVGQVLPPFLYFSAKRSRGMGSHGIFCYYNYLAYSTALVSRMTLTLIWPGYSSSDSIFFATSRASRIILSSVTSSGLTMMRTSRPAWMA